MLMVVHADCAVSPLLILTAVTSQHFERPRKAELWALITTVAVY